MFSPVQVDTFGLPINQEACFTYKGKINKGFMNQQLKNLKPFASLIKMFLEPGEEILLSSRGSSPTSFLEQYTHGWIISYIKRCVLVFTNKRIFHFPSTYNWTSRNSVAQIYYGDIDNFKFSSFLSVAFRLTYKSGKKEAFLNLPSKIQRKLKELLPSLIQNGQTSPAHERVHLCPSCKAVLVKDQFSCGQCHMQFKDGKTASKLSVILPGGGDFYTRHPILGLMNAFGELVIFIGFLAGILDLATGKAGAGVTLIVFAILIFYEKIVGIYHAKRYVEEYIPMESNFTPIKAG